MLKVQLRWCFYVLVIVTVSFRSYGGQVLTDDDECIDGTVPTAYPAKSQSGNNNNGQVTIDGYASNTYQICAGEYIILTAGGGGDCDLDQGTGCVGCSGLACADKYNNSTDVYVWGGDGLQGAAYDTLNSKQVVRAPIDWGTQIQVTVTREECTRKQPEDAAKKTATLTIIATEPVRVGITSSQHSSGPQRDVASLSTTQTKEVLIKDEDGYFQSDFDDDHNCCKGIKDGGVTTFVDTDVYSDGDPNNDALYANAHDIDTAEKYVAIQGGWTVSSKKKQFILLSSWTWDPTIDTDNDGDADGDNGPERRSFATGYTSTSKVYLIFAGTSAAVDWTWLHEWGHLQGLHDLYCNPSNGCDNSKTGTITDPKYPDNFMNKFEGKYVGTDQGPGPSCSPCTRPTDGDQCAEL